MVFGLVHGAVVVEVGDGVVVGGGVVWVRALGSGWRKLALGGTAGLVANGELEGDGSGWVWVLDGHSWQGEGVVTVETGALDVVEIEVAEGEVEAFVCCG